MEKKNNILMKNNALVKARYDINLYENKLFILILHKLQKMNDTRYKCDIKRSEIQSMINARTVNTSKAISSILEGLRRKPIYIKQRCEDGSFDWGIYGFINGFIYNDKSDIFKIEASETVQKLLRDYLEDGYTPINLKIWIDLKNTYAQRFYDLLRLWSNSKSIVTYSLDELKMFLMLENKYPKYAEFKRRVISPAIKELNATGFFEIDIKENKVGKKVDSIDFIVKDLDKRVYFEKKQNKKIIELEPKEFKTETLDSNSIKKNKIDDFYIPNKKLFTTKTLSDFINDFNQYNFKDTEYKKMLQESILIALEKDDEEKIKVKSYSYFKKTLENKIDTLVSGQSKTNKDTYKKTAFHNFTETFTQYSPDELEDMIEKNQREKYK